MPGKCCWATVGLAGCTLGVNVMSQETRHSVRIPVPAEQQTAALRIGRREVLVRLLNVSAGGCSVEAEEPVQAELGEHVQVRTAAGWTAAKVVSNSHDEAGNFLGLQWLCDVAVPGQGKKRRRGRRGLLANLWVELGVLVLLAGCGWGVITVLQRFANPSAKANPASAAQQQSAENAAKHRDCRREAALGVREVILNHLAHPELSGKLALSEGQSQELRVLVDESLVEYLREARLLPDAREASGAPAE